MSQTSLSSAPPDPTPLGKQIPAKYVWWGFGLVTFALALRPISPHDIWFILLMGHRAIETLSVPHHEFFLYTADGAPDLFGTWGYGVLADLARRALGLYGLILFNAGLWCSAYVMAFMAIRQRLGRSLLAPFSASEIAGLALTMLLLYEAVLIRSWMRPEVTIFLAWAAGFFLMESGRRNGTFRHALIIYPLIIWAEAWLHTAGPILLVPLVAYGTERLWNLVSLRPKLTWNTITREMSPWILSFLAAVILPVFNPNGIPQVYAHLDMFMQLFTQNHSILSGFSVSSAGMPIADTHKYNVEYMAAWEWPPYYRIYCQTICIGVISFIFGQRRLVSFASILPIAAFAILHVRGIGLLAWSILIPFAVVSVELVEMVARLTNKGASKGRSPLLLPLALAVILCGLIGLNNKYDLQMVFPVEMPLANGLQKIHQRYPNGGNVFTDLHLGAITAWSLGKDFKVAVAAHVMRGHPEMTRHVGAMNFVREGWENEIHRYNVIAAVLRPTNLPNPGLKPLTLRLLFHPEWELSHIETEASIFIRRPANQPALPAAERLEQVRHFWEMIRSVVEDVRNMQDPTARRALAASAKQLAIIKQSTSSPEDTLARLQSEAEKLPEWYGDVSTP